MDKIKVRPCKCGSHKTYAGLENFGVGWLCYVGCMDVNCDRFVVRHGLTKNHAVRRAAKAWNRRADNG